MIDNRVLYKECTTLAANGFNTHLIINADREQVINNVKIIPLKESKSRLKRMTVKQLSALKKALSTDSVIYHLHDPELIPVGIFLKLLNKKVIFDFHELVYYQIEDKEYLNRRLKKIAQAVYQLFEKWGVSEFDGLILAENGYKDYFLKYYKKHFNKIIFLRNYPIISVLKDIKPAKIEKSKPIVAYLGDLTYIRGIIHMLKAIEILNGEVEFMLIGKWGSDEIKKQAEREKGWQYTNYLGFLPPEKAYSFLKNADIGLALVHPVKNHTTSKLVKIFEYMGLGIPTLLSNFEYWKESFGNLCYYADPLNPEEIAKEIREIIKNKEKSTKKAQLAQEFVMKNCPCENESKNLINLYNEIINK